MTATTAGVRRTDSAYARFVVVDHEGGYLVSCADIETIYDDEVRADVGAVTASAMRRIEAGLRAALGMAE